MPKNFSKGNLCFLCGKVVSPGRKFCSRRCKALSQTKKIKLICSGCGKSFTIWPYLKRKSNYCSINCYRDFTRRGQKRICKFCHQEFLAKAFLIAKGFGVYCNRKCQFADYPKPLEKSCLKCGKSIKMWPSKEGKVKFCSKKCKDDFERDYVTRICRKCGQEFELPRSDLNRGRGNFCTYRCYLTYRGPSTLEEKMERALCLAGIKFKREVKFKRFHTDFLMEETKTVIECDGEHWHLNQKIRERDKRKDKLLNDLGYKVLRFSGRTMDKLSEIQLAKNVARIIST